MSLDILFVSGRAFESAELFSNKQLMALLAKIKSFAVVVGDDDKRA